MICINLGGDMGLPLVVALVLAPMALLVLIAIFEEGIGAGIGIAAVVLLFLVVTAAFSGRGRARPIRESRLNSKPDVVADQRAFKRFMAIKAAEEASKLGERT